jgi:hypothetical protein
LPIILGLVNNLFLVAHPLNIKMASKRIFVIKIFKLTSHKGHGLEMLLSGAISVSGHAMAKRNQSQVLNLAS